ncbi:MAG: diaminopimelate decarboxylase [Chitinophagaceae bacterium]|nr:diaminopimelate decarboxylase [Chitinophagaceae bacterium]
MPQVLTHQQLLETAKEFGTPLYVYHAERITEQYLRLKEAFRETNASFFYACKALTNVNILRHIRQIGCNVDCSSVNEVKLALSAGFEPARILYTSNNIAFSEITEAVGLGVNINIDSLSNLRKFADQYGHSYPVGVRLRPNIMAGGNIKISTGHGKSKFGIPVEDIDKVIDLIREKDLQIRTLHIHTGSEIKDVEVFVKGIEVLFDLAPRFPALKTIDLGGGIKVPYKPGEEGTDVALLGKRVKEEFEGFAEKTGRRLQVWFEPGKFLVSEAGYLIVQTTVLKQSGATCFVGVDSGLNHLIRPMFYGSYHHIENISNNSGALRPYHIVGNICETDSFAEDRMVAEIREGDYLVLYNAGAYGFEMASNYNARFKPAEVLVKDNKAQLIRRRDTLDDLLATQLILKD